MDMKLAPAPDATAAPETTFRLLGPVRLATDLLDSGEPWLSKKALAAHFAVSPSSVNNYMREGMPHWHQGRDAKFRVSECTLWLRQTGRLTAGGAA